MSPTGVERTAPGPEPDAGNSESDRTPRGTLRGQNPRCHIPCANPRASGHACGQPNRVRREEGRTLRDCSRSHPRSRCERVLTPHTANQPGRARQPGMYTWSACYHGVAISVVLRCPASVVTSPDAWVDLASAIACHRNAAAVTVRAPALIIIDVHRKCYGSEERGVFVGMLWSRRRCRRRCGSVPCSCLARSHNFRDHKRQSLDVDSALWRTAGERQKSWKKLICQYPAG